MRNNLTQRDMKLFTKMMNKLVAPIYPVITDIETYLSDLPDDTQHLILKINTTIPEGITSKNYWTSEYADMDFSYLSYYYVDEVLAYLGIPRNSVKIRETYAFNINGDLIGDF